MRKTHLIFIITIIICSVIVTLISVRKLCNVSDDEAISIAKHFLKRVDVNSDGEPSIKRDISQILVFGLRSKLVLFGKDSNALLLNIDCNNGNVVNFKNRGLLYRASNRSSSNGGRNSLAEPQILDKEKARLIILSYGNLIGLPGDVLFSSIRLDKTNSVWIGQWKRSFNGIEFEGDYVAISIMASGGELYGYSNSIHGTTSKTEPSITQKQAIDVSYNEFASFFSETKWNQNKNKFEVKSVELKLVNSSSFLSQILFSRYDTKLAWVVVIDTKKGMDSKTVGILNKDPSIFRVDAITNKLISSEINVVP